MKALIKPLVFMVGLMSAWTGMADVPYPGSGDELGTANELLTYPGIDGNSLNYHLGDRRPFKIRYAENIDPQTFAAVLNGRDISRRFRPSAGGDQRIYLNLRRGQNTLELRAGSMANAAGENVQDLDTFAITLQPPRAIGSLLAEPPPGFENSNVPPVVNDGSVPLLIDKSRR